MKTKKTYTKEENKKLSKQHTGGFMSVFVLPTDNYYQQIRIDEENQLKEKQRRENENF